jgi:hypothetical protein
MRPGNHFGVTIEVISAGLCPVSVCDA